MIAIDTNLIVRLLTQDHPDQFKNARRLFSTEDIYIPDTVILETEWVLRHAYEFPASEICAVFRRLFGLKNVHLDNATLVAQAIDWHEKGLDFADAMHLAHSQKLEVFKTFDKHFIKHAKALSSCIVEKP